VVTQNDGQASLYLVVKTSSGWRGMFCPHGDLRNVAYADHVRCMVRDHAQIERGKYVVC
jgi:hypothetical protein